METKDIIKLIEISTGLKYKYNQDTFKGGDVLEPTVRFAESVYVVDYKRFYPHLILMFNLYNGKLNELLKSLLHNSIHLEGEAKLSSKLVLNKIYGLMKHFDLKETEKVTLIGRQIIQQTRELLSKEYKILSSDTDSVTIQCNDIEKLQGELDYISKKFNSYAKNYQPTFKLEIENHFKYIYFFPNKTGFKKKQYLGVRQNGEIILKSKRLNFDEQLAFGFIAQELRKGNYQVNIDEFIKFTEKVLKENNKFINLENITILELNKPLVMI